MNITDYIEQVAYYVKKYAKAHGILVHSPIIAQAILESWKSNTQSLSTLAGKYHNYHGMKCGSKWTGKSVNLNTKEEYNGVLVGIKDNFRVYDSMEEGIKGYFEFIQITRYQNLKGITDPKEYLTTIKQDGYCTGSTYVSNCMKLINHYQLTKYDEVSEVMSKTRSEIVNLAESWIGKNESDGTHKTIIDIYNTYLPRPRGYKVRYTDKWCAITVSALAIQLGYTDIIPIECSCYYMIKKAESMKIWKESDSYIPKPGDFVMYDWDDKSGTNVDNTGTPEHVGIVTRVINNTFFVVEGNYDNSVKVRTMTINGKYIRGYIVPNYDVEDVKTDEVIDTLKEFVKNVQKCTGAKVDGIAGPETLSKTITVSANKNKRHEVVKVIQKQLNELGFDCGKVDGVAGPKFTNAVKKYQSANGCTSDGVITAKNKTWKKLLGLL